MKVNITVVLAAVMVAAFTAMGATVPARADVDVYTTPGPHHVNGRDWWTSCEPYSQTERCRTEIRATKVSEVNGRFVATTGWVFNNLTYLPAPRGLWTGNPLGGNGEVGAKVAWTAPDGRRWSTECDTATTGRNGCRSYTRSRVIEAHRSNGTWHYRWVTTSVFNNIVLFAGANWSPRITMPDANLRTCINEILGRPAASSITRAQAGTVVEVECVGDGISNLTGLEHFSNLEVLLLDDNNVRSLAPLGGLRKLDGLVLWDNDVVDVSPLAGITTLEVLDLSGNAVRDVTPLARLDNLFILDLTSNDVTRAAPLAGLAGLEILGLFDNPLTDRQSLNPLIAAGCEVLFDQPVSWG